MTHVIRTLTIVVAFVLTTLGVLTAAATATATAGAAQPSGFPPLTVERQPQGF
jgi:hypothetical protein